MMRIVLSFIFTLQFSSVCAQTLYRHLPKEYQNTYQAPKKSKRVKRTRKKAKSQMPSFRTKTAKIITKKNPKPKFREITEKITFNYFSQFLGPSLSPDYQTGATYNRFKTGQDFKGDSLDSTGSHQMFHAVTLGYNLTNDYLVSFGYTFQEDINKDIRYKDSFGQTAFRRKEVSDNNKRVNLLVRNLINNKNFYVNTNYFYEMSSTINSVFQDMEYGLGIEPSINFKHGNSGFYSGVLLSLQRNYFKNNEILFAGNLYPTRYQTMLVQVNPYLNYQFNDYMTLRTSLMFDWDKRGNQVERLSEFNANMDNVGRIGMNFLIDYGISAGTFLEFGLEQASLSKTAVGATLNVTLF